MVKKRRLIEVRSEQVEVGIDLETLVYACSIMSSSKNIAAYVNMHELKCINPVKGYVFIAQFYFSMNPSPIVRLWHLLSLIRA